MREIACIGVLILFVLQTGAEALAASERLLSCGSGSGKVEFEAIGRPSLLKIHGKSAGPECKIRLTDRQASGELALDLNQLDTGIETRTRHMKEKYLETERFQKARLVLEPISIPLSGFDGKAIPFSGTLELHGVRKPVQGTARIDLDGPDQVRGARADFELKLTDFGISIPQFAGIIVSDKVNVHVVLDRLETNLPNAR